MKCLPPINRRFELGLTIINGIHLFRAFEIGGWGNLLRCMESYLTDIYNDRGYTGSVFIWIFWLKLYRFPYEPWCKWSACCEEHRAFLSPASDTRSSHFSTTLLLSKIFTGFSTFGCTRPARCWRARSVHSPPPPPSSRHTIFFFSSSRKMLTIEISNWSRLGQRQSGDVIAAVASHQHLRQQPKLKRIGPLDCSIRTRFFAPSNDPGRLCAMLPPLCAKLRAPVALASPTACPDCWNYGRDGTRPITASSLLPPVTR